MIFRCSLYKVRAAAPAMIDTDVTAVMYTGNEGCVPCRMGSRSTCRIAATGLYWTIQPNPLLMKTSAGTITGVARVIKKRNPNFKAIAVEPSNSPVITQFKKGEPLKPGPHKIQGAGAGFIPNNLHLKDAAGNPQIAECVKVTNDDAFAMARRSAKEEGLLVGISSGAAIWAAVEVARRAESAGKLIVVIIPSFGERYLSTPLFADLAD